MKYLPLVWRNLTRRKTRTIFTVLSIAVAFVLFGILAALNAAFSQGVELAGNDRLIITHKVSIIQLLPQSYEARLETTPGVVDVLHQTYFGGIYQKPSNFFMQCPVRPDRLLKLYPEYVLPDEREEVKSRSFEPSPSTSNRSACSTVHDAFHDQPSEKPVLAPRRARTTLPDTTSRSFAASPFSSTTASCALLVSGYTGPALKVPVPEPT